MDIFLKFAGKKEYALFLNTPSLPGRLIHTPQRVQAAGIPDIGQALGQHLYEELLIIPDSHIGRGMAGQLGFTAALGRQEQKVIISLLAVIQAVPGIIIPEAVIDPASG